MAEYLVEPLLSVEDAAPWIKRFEGQYSFVITSSNKYR